MRKINYNNQRNNIVVNNLNSYSQCFSTSNWMRMSYYTDKIKADDDKGLSDFLQYLELVAGPKEVHAEHPSLHYVVQALGVTKWLNQRNVYGHDVFVEQFPAGMLIKKLEDGPITIGTKKIGKLLDGHIILLVDYDKEKASFVVNDPFGNAITDYTVVNGHNVLYPASYLLPFIGTKCRILYWQENK